ncbi:hypothetical protein MMC13_004516 [Lambiella insularis]|nr:hypothetical protein [Lambiella insularis]
MTAQLQQPQNGWASQAGGAPSLQLPYRTGNEKNWCFKGYPAFSEWMASDNDLFIVRRFGTLSARVALMLQDRISRLSEELDKVDKECQNRCLHNGDFRGDESVFRQELLERIAVNLERYNQFILNHAQMKARPDATKHQVGNVKAWLFNNENAIREDEAAFIEAEGDLVPVVPRVKVPLRRLIEKSDFMHLFRVNKAKPNRSQSKTTIYTEDTRVDKVVTFTVISIGLGMLIGPLWWLQQITADESNLQIRLGIITGFIIGFAGILSIVTVAKPFEVLAATAAYSAVLMVFMQLGGPASGSGG